MQPYFRYYSLCNSERILLEAYKIVNIIDAFYSKGIRVWSAVRILGDSMVKLLGFTLIQ